jgi:hypothetical protein
MVKRDSAVTRACNLARPRGRRSNVAIRSVIEQFYSVESLERRVFLTTVGFVPTTTNLHDLQNGPLAKAGENLANIYFGYRSAQRAGTLAAYVAAMDKLYGQTDVNALELDGSSIGVELVASGKLSTFAASMEALGMNVQSITPADNAIGGFLPITLLSQVTQQHNVLHVTPQNRPVYNQEGVSPNQADQAMQTLAARTSDGLTGAGVTVGVISNSVNEVGGGLADSVASGDLPKHVKVIQDLPAADGPGDDEGRAILEQIHDLAPDASLIFDTAGGTQQSMATAIAALQAAGANVIIDDISFLTEPFFQPGVIDQAITKAVAAGVTYVTAAGNEADSGFEQAANFVSQDTGPAGGEFGGGGFGGGGFGGGGLDAGDEFINFNPNGTASTRMNISISQSGGTLTFEWDDPYDGVTGTVQGDLDINLYDATGNNLLYSGSSNALATGVPVQQIEDLPAGNYQVQIVANSDSIALPRYYEFVDDTDSGSAISSTQFTGTRTSIVGHNGDVNAISVGAVNYPDAPPYSTTTPIPTEPFSSQGPVIQSRDANGNLLVAAVTNDEPNFSGSDGNTTSFFGINLPSDPSALPQFFGTSSAAGNVAGAVALLKQAVPGASPAEIRTALEQTAIPLNGQATGTYNIIGGFGLTDTVAAVTRLQATVPANAPVATIAPVNPSPRETAVTTINIAFNEPVAGFTVSDLTLTLNGGANLLTSNQTLTTSDNENFVLGNLASITTTYGNYLLTLPAGASVTSQSGVALQAGASDAFVTEADPGIPVQPSNFTAASNSSSSVTLNYQEQGGGETGFLLQRSTNSAFTGKVISTDLADDSTSYTDNTVAPGTVYYYRLDATNATGTSLWSKSATAITYATGEVIMDNNTSNGVTITGEWDPSTAVLGYEGTNYIQDGDSGKGSKSVKYHPNLSSAGEYDIYATWTTDSDRATNVPFDIYSSAGTLLQTVKVNERSTGGNGWTLIGEYDLHSGTASFVRIRNGGTNGEVVANGIKFLPAGAIERQDGTLTLASSAATPAISRPLVTSTSTRKDDEVAALHAEVDS